MTKSMKDIVTYLVCKPHNRKAVWEYIFAARRYA